MTKLLLVTYAFAAPWCYGFLSIGGDRIALTDVLLPIAAALILTRIRLPLTELQWLLLLYPVIALLASLAVLGTGIEDAVFLKTARLWGTFAPALLLTTSEVDMADLRRYVKAWAAGGGLSLMIGVAGFYLGWDFTAAHQTWGFNAGELLPRAGGVFQESGAYGHLLASWCVVTLLFAPTLTSRKRRVPLCASVAALTALGLVVNVSRSAMLNLLVTAAVAVMLPATSSRRKRLAVAVCTVTVVAAALTFFAPEGTALGALRDRCVETYEGLALAADVLDQTSSGRLSNWGLALDVWLERPLFGAGYKTMIPLYGSPGDSTFILALAETGIAGGLALMLLFGLFVRRGVAMTVANAPLGRVLLIIWAGQFAHSLNVDVITFSGSMFAVLLLSAAIWTVRDQTETEASCASC
ncbi:MAG TPA: O-antigen ligase family protein [Bryobacteraceae bacterium]|nr:O-antigen ligase family protein [Bryobacteraceae bacterium]